MFSCKSTPANTKKHWSSASGQHHISFHETFRLLKLHKRSQVLDSVSTVMFQVSLYLPSTTDHSSMLFFQQWKIGKCFMIEVQVTAQNQ